MLQLKECRKILGPECDLSDQVIEHLRDQLCDLASVVIALYEEQRQDAPAVEGAAAMLEFLGGRSGSEAERLAVQQYFEGVAYDSG